MDWSLVVGGMSILGLFLSTTWQKIGWTYGLCSQVPWGVYGVLTHQRGIWIMSAVFAVFYARALWRWRHSPLELVKRPAKPAATAEEPQLAA